MAPETLSTTEDGRTVVKFGNANPQMQIKVYDEDPTKPETWADPLQPKYHQIRIPAPHINQSVTEVVFWEGFDSHDNTELTLSTENDRMLALIARLLPDQRRKYAVGLNEMEQIILEHAGGVAPDWVVSSNSALAQALSEHFNCPIGEPTNLLTNVGRDAVHDQHLKVGSQPAAFGWMSLSANTSAEVATNTTLPGEITTASGGLIRASATYAHTVGTNTSTLTKTFTANGSDSLPVVVAKIGVHNALTVGILAYEKLLNATSTLNVSGDSVTVTWTDTAG